MANWTQLLWQMRARLGYTVARWMMRWPALVRQPQIWQWMQGQFARLANLGDRSAQSFYGHILLFRGQGPSARSEGVRLLRLAAQAGEGKSAYQLGVLSLQGSLELAADAAAAASWWELAAKAGHPLAARKLAQLYREGGPGLSVDMPAALRMEQRAAELGL